MDLLQLINDSWFGRPAAPQDLAEADEAPDLRRGSAGSLSDGPAGAEQDAVAAAAARRREAARRQPSVSQPAVGPPRPLNGRPLLDEEQDGVLGTWAGRQRIFSELLKEQEEQGQPPRPGGMPPRPPPAASATAGVAAAAAAAGAADLAAQQGGSSGGPVVLAPPPLPAHTAAAAVPHAGEASLDAEMNAAWRWRFTRKWQAEQLKALEAPAAGGPGGGGEEEEEEWSEALRLMDAVDGGLNMQIGRTLSLHNSSMADTAGLSLDPSLTLMSPGLSQLLLDGSIKESPLREEAATTQIVSMARKAQLLRMQQQEIERQVSERWEAASGGGQWVAQHLPAVQIDSWSAFPFVLVRLSEPRGQRQKLLVRGRNGCTEQQAFAAAEQEAARAAIAHRLPGPRVELVATGRIEWAAAGPAQRRTLLVRVGRLLPPAAKDARLHSPPAASTVVAELTRASFPAGDFEVVAADPAPSGSSR